MATAWPLVANINHKPALSAAIIVVTLSAALYTCLQNVSFVSVIKLRNLRTFLVSVTCVPACTDPLKGILLHYR